MDQDFYTRILNYCYLYNVNICLNYSESTNLEKIANKLRLNSYLFKRFLLNSPIISVINRSGIKDILNKKKYLKFKENDAVGNFISKIKKYDTDRINIDDFDDLADDISF